VEARLNALKKQYGDEEGESIYNKMESEGKNKRVKKQPKKKKFRRFKK